MGWGGAGWADYYGDGAGRGGRTIMGWGGAESGDRAQGPRKKRADE